MTQKEKIMKLTIALQRVSNVASNLKDEARDYDVHFAKQRADEIKEIVNDTLKKGK